MIELDKTRSFQTSTSVSELMSVINGGTSVLVLLVADKEFARMHPWFRRFIVIELGRLTAVI
jgi:hypothetical protein